MITTLIQLVREEFSGYSLSTLQKDVLAGLTVGAVALPLALAFGIASGSTAAAGLVTAILSGLIIGTLSGAPYQISGPTGAMSAVLILIAHKFGMEGVWITGFASGVLILLIGIFKVGRMVTLIPASVITGFTSGIAIIIFVGQIQNFLGTPASTADNSITKLFDYLRFNYTPNWQTIITASVVMAMIFLMPKRINKRVPGSLIGLILATLLVFAFGWQEPVIGDIPRTLLLDQRLTFSTGISSRLPELLVPILSITALGAIESLLCGVALQESTGKKLNGDQELIAQGIGNMIMPLFGGVPATAAIARSSVGVASGGQTRVVSIVHALMLLMCVFVLGPVLAEVPLAALAGVLMATAIRMNDWDEIRWLIGHRFKSSLIAFFVTMLATAALDLTQAILLGMLISMLLFVYRSSNVQVERKDVDVTRLQSRGHSVASVHPDISVVYLTGPMFFGAAPAFRQAFAGHGGNRVLILSMRGVPLIDVSGIRLVEELLNKQRQCEGSLMLCAVQPNVQRVLDRCHLTDEIGKTNFFWSADQAILAASQRLGMM